MGLRWWNEVDTATGDSHWVFESQDRSGDGGGPVQNATDKRYVGNMRGAGGGVLERMGDGRWIDGEDWENWRGRFDGRAGLIRGCDRFFWLALYAQPGLWVGLAIFALVRLESPIWLSLNGECNLC